jgi:hypothetical protein
LAASTTTSPRSSAGCQRAGTAARASQRHQFEIGARHFAHLVEAHQPLVGGRLVDVLLEQEDFGGRLAARNLVERIAEQAAHRKVNDEGRHRDGQHHQHEKAEKQASHAASRGANIVDHLIFLLGLHCIRAQCAR